MKIKTHTINQYLLVEMEGELDMETAPQFKKKVISEMEANNLNHLIINLDGVNFIDSTGVGAILGRYRSLDKKDGRVFLAGLNKRVKRIFRLSGILKLMPVYESVETLLDERGIKCE